MKVKWRAYPVGEDDSLNRVDGTIEVDSLPRKLQPAIARRVYREFPYLSDCYIYVEDNKNESE